MLPTEIPFRQYTDLEGKPLDAGYIYFGQVDKNPETDPVAVYWDAEGTQPAAQPIRTMNGFPVRAGTPSQVFCAVPYSVEVRDRKRRLVCYGPDSEKFGIYGVLSANTGSGLIGWIQDAIGAVKRWIQDKVREHISLQDFGGAADEAADNYAALVKVFAAYPSGGVAVRLPGSTKAYRFATLNANGVSNITLYGDGIGVTILELDVGANPVSDSFIMQFIEKSGITFRDMTIRCTAAARGIFDLGTYDPATKTYTGSLNGKLSGIGMRSCTKVTFERVRFDGFNNSGLLTWTTGGSSTAYNDNFTFIDCEGSFNRITPINMQGQRNLKVRGGTFTDNGLFTDQFVDCGTGYGIVIGRLADATTLKTVGADVSGVFTARNARHGIDSHNGVDLNIHDCISEDDLLMHVFCQDPAGTIDDRTGVINIVNPIARHTAWVESKYPLITYQSAGVERPDSIPYFVSRPTGSTTVKSASLINPKVYTWRFRQLATNTTSDQIQFASINATDSVTIKDVDLKCDNASYYPSWLIDATAAQVTINGKIKSGIRSTVSKPHIRINSESKNSIWEGLSVEILNVYSTGTTQAAYPILEKVRSDDKAIFRGNDIKPTAQGVRGSLLKTTTTNWQYGYNGYWGVNEGNLYDGKPYSSAISGDFTLYVSSTGAGRFDGSDASNAMKMTSASDVDFILAQLPKVVNGTLYIKQADATDLGAGAPSALDNVPCVFSSALSWDGVSSENGYAESKTASVTTTANNLFKFPYGANVAFRYMQLKSGGIVVDGAKTITACALKNTGTGAGSYCFRAGGIKAQVSQTSVEKGQFGLAAEATGEIVSIGNGTVAGQQSTYGLYANSGRVYKNGSQPTGSTANELTQNGGSIA